MLYMTYIAIAMAYVLYYFSECVEAIQQCNNLCKCINGELSQHLNQMSYHKCSFAQVTFLFILFLPINITLLILLSFILVFN